MTLSAFQVPASLIPSSSPLRTSLSRPTAELEARADGARALLHRKPRPRARDISSKTAEGVELGAHVVGRQLYFRILSPLNAVNYSNHGNGKIAHRDCGGATGQLCGLCV